MTTKHQLEISDPFKVREGGTVQRRACYLVLGVTVDGERDVLGMWFHNSERVLSV